MIHFGSPIEETTPVATPKPELIWHPVFGFIEKDK